MCKKNVQTGCTGIYTAAIWMVENNEYLYLCQKQWFEVNNNLMMNLLQTQLLGYFH